MTTAEEATADGAAAEVSFYHLTATPLDQALPRVLARALETGARVVVVAGSAERVRHLDQILWTYDPDSFLPHGSAATGRAERQPIWLTDRAESPNAATLVALVDGWQGDYPAWPGLARVLDFFDAGDAEAVAAARARYKAARAAGRRLRYFKQEPSGRWTEAG